ncbi:hypothetical protein RvY_04760-2 [Ramazzottius varieornatus]|uniref:Uncharacterized protein n=1 Tax=Ramazzottius varieornatus TaxID=947166 RepID=A0A1D1V1W2_RAMVA|nr:hypothetical protein RvY_04760-2 [Ramazzottius varieornatus]
MTPAMTATKYPPLPPTIKHQHTNLNPNSTVGRSRTFTKLLSPPALTKTTTTTMTTPTMHRLPHLPITSTDHRSPLQLRTWSRTRTGSTLRHLLLRTTTITLLRLPHQCTVPHHRLPSITLQLPSTAHLNRCTVRRHLLTVPRPTASRLPHTTMPFHRTMLLLLLTMLRGASSIRKCDLVNV